jgi:P27 family predicted phage terminase small subunit
MGQRGPKPVPSEVLKARGTFRPDRHADSARPLGKPKCPSWLKDKDARAEWRRVVKTLTDMGIVGEADSNLIVRYCTAWVRWRRVVQTLVATPGSEYAVYKDADGKPKSVQVSALHSIARSLSDELGRAEAALGMSPSARSRIEVSLPAPAAEAPKSRFFTDSPMRIAQ